MFEDKYIGKAAIPACCWKIIIIKKFDKTEAYSLRKEMPFKQDMHSLRYL